MAWHDFVASVPADATFQPHIADAYDVTNILFSSGTTGTQWLYLTPVRLTRALVTI